MKISKLLVLGTLVVALGVATIARAVVDDCTANPDPPGCNANQVSLGIAIYDAVTNLPIPAGTVLAGQELKFRVILARPDLSILDLVACNYIGGQITVTLPNGTPSETAGFGGSTPDVPCVYDLGAGLFGPFAPDTYFVSQLDAVVGFITVYADYGETTDYPDQTNGTFRSDPLEATATATTSSSKNVAPLNPAISIDKQGSRTAFCENGSVDVTYTYDVENTGTEDLTSVVVDDDFCDSVTGPTGDDGDGYLNPGETWTYTCTTAISDTTLNTVDVDAVGRYTGTPVTASDFWEVLAVAPPTVSVSPPSAEICQGGSQQFCAIPPGDPADYDSDFTYLWTPGGQTTRCITPSATGKYCVTVTEIASGCSAQACGTLQVNPNPSCELAAVAPPVCPSIGGNFIAANVTGGTPGEAPAPAYTYAWGIKLGTGAGWAIVGATNDDQVEYSVADVADECATFTLTVTDSKGCDSSCELEVCCTGNTFCSFTQGYWGNAGGTACNGKTTTELINQALGSGPVVVGQLTGNSLTLDTAQCILDLLPAGGTPAVLPEGDWTCTDLNGLTKPDKGRGNSGKPSKPSTLNNVLIGQVVALTLNLRVSENCLGVDSNDLGAFVLEPEFCTVPYGDEEACAEISLIPESLADGVMDVAGLLLAANQMLAGTYEGEASIGDIYNAVTAINEAFDECRTVVPCIRPEICGNGCDDDGDGLTDCCDPDCGCEICGNLIDDDADGNIDELDDCVICDLDGLD